MKTTKRTQAEQLAALAALTPEQLETLAAIAAAMTASETAPEAPKGKKAPEAPKAPKGKKTAKAPKLDPEAWVSFITEDGPHMGKAKNLPEAAENVTAHETQGQALQAVNAMRKASQAQAPKAPKGKKTAKAKAPKAKAPKTETAPVIAPNSDDLDALAARRDARNRAIIATIPEAKRGAVENKLTQLHNAGYRYARLECNKKHQLDGLHIYPGAKGHGRDAAFKACTTKKAQEWRQRADKARAAGKPAPKPVAGQFVWSPVGGGNLYARGIFGPVKES